MATSLSGKEESPGLSRIKREMQLIKQEKRKTCQTNSVSEKVHVPAPPKPDEDVSDSFMGMSRKTPAFFLSKPGKDVSDSFMGMSRETPAPFLSKPGDDSEDSSTDMFRGEEDDEDENSASSVCESAVSLPVLRDSRNSLFKPPSLPDVTGLLSSVNIDVDEDLIRMSVPQIKNVSATDEFRLMMNNLRIRMQAHEAEARTTYEKTLSDARLMAEEAIRQAEEAIAEGHMSAQNEYHASVKREFYKESMHMFSEPFWGSMHAMKKWQESTRISLIIYEEMVTVHNLAFNHVLEEFLGQCSKNMKPKMPEKKFIEHTVKSMGIFTEHLGPQFDSETQECLGTYFVPFFLNKETSEIDTSKFCDAVTMLKKHVNKFRLKVAVPQVHKTLVEYSFPMYENIMEEIKHKTPEEIQAAVNSMLTNANWIKTQDAP